LSYEQFELIKKDREYFVKFAARMEHDYKGQDLDFYVDKKAEIYEKKRKEKIRNARNVNTP